MMTFLYDVCLAIVVICVVSALAIISVHVTPPYNVCIMCIIVLILGGMIYYSHRRKTL